MALISCPECGHKISDQAKACPQCGHPNQENENIYVNNPMKGKVIMIIGAILVFVFLVSLIVILNRNTTPVVKSLAVTSGVMGFVLIMVGRIKHWFYWG